MHMGATHIIYSLLACRIMDLCSSFFHTFGLHCIIHFMMGDIIFVKSQCYILFNVDESDNKSQLVARILSALGLEDTASGITYIANYFHYYHCIISSHAQCNHVTSMDKGYVSTLELAVRVSGTAMTKVSHEVVTKCSLLDTKN